MAAPKAPVIAMPKNGTTKVRFCPCKSEFQDKKYGVGKRLANLTQKPGSPWRCTVCGQAGQ